MAQVIWPLMIPVSILLMEENSKRKRILRILSGIGLLLSIYYSYCLLTFTVNPEISGHHILYKNGFPRSLSNPAFGFYLIATITPLFISGIRRTWLLGILMTLSCLVTAIFFRQYLTSVWCFFAALISGVIFWILSDSHKELHFKQDKIIETGDPEKHNDTWQNIICDNYSSCLCSAIVQGILKEHRKTMI